MATLEVCRQDRLAFTGPALLQDDGSSVALEDERLIVKWVHGRAVLVVAISRQPIEHYVLNLSDVVTALTPDPIVPCGRCARHGALFRVEGTYVCGTGNAAGRDRRPCHQQVSLFAMPIGAQGERLQAYVDELLKEQGYPLDGHEPRVWEGDNA